jgi:hypothetical protein
MISFFKNNLLWSQSGMIALVVILLALGAFFVYRPLFYAVCIVFIFLLYFYRNPERVCQEA